MAQIVQRSTITNSKVSIRGAVFIWAVAGWLLTVIFRSDYLMEVRVVREQPVPFSQKDHVSGLDIDCSYYHTSSFAGMPPIEACAPEFQRFADGEFPSKWNELVNRPRWLPVMASSLALAGRSPWVWESAEKIVLYVRAAKEAVPDKPSFFATASNLGGLAKGVLVVNHMGQPTKVEGNPQHPARLGVAEVSAKASVLPLYDPDGSQAVIHTGRITSWVTLLAALHLVREEQPVKERARLRILTESANSAVLADQIRILLAQLPNATWHQYEPIGREDIPAGAQLAFDAAVTPLYRFDNANVVLALGTDFLGWSPANQRYTRDFVSRRRIAVLNRRYAVERTPSLAGSMADHRRHVRPRKIDWFARGVEHQLGLTGVAHLGVRDAAFLDALIGDLRSHRGASLVVAGNRQPSIVHALAHAINRQLGNDGTTVFLAGSVDACRSATLVEFVAEMKAGAVDLLRIVGGNSEFTVPTDLHFGEHLSNLKMRVHLGPYKDEISLLCHWHVPEAHELETWSKDFGHRKLKPNLPNGVCQDSALGGRASQPDDRWKVDAQGSLAGEDCNAG